MIIRKKLKCLALLIAMSFIVTGCSKSSNTDKKHIMIYSSLYQDFADEIEKALEEKFPNYDVELLSAGTGVIQSKINAELESNKLGCDMLLVADPSFAIKLKEDGLLEKINIDNADKLIAPYDKDGYWYPVRIVNMVLAYNKSKNDIKDVAQSFEEFAGKKELKGNLSMPDPLISGSALASIVSLYDGYGEEIYKKLGEQDVTVESGPLPVTKLETGEVKEIMALEQTILKKKDVDGSDIEVIYPKDGIISIPSPLMTVKYDKSKNNDPKACEDITKWFLSDEGQSVIVKNWMHSVLKDYDKVPNGAKPMSELSKFEKPIDWENVYKNRDKYCDLFAKYVNVSKK